MTGARRIGGAVAALVLLLAPMRAAAETFLLLDSQRGDYIGMGEAQRFTEAEGDFALAGGGDVVSVVVTSNPGPWYLVFAAPQGVPLMPGPYENAQRAPLQSPTKPGLSATGDGRACNAISGRFVVLDIAYGLDGGLTRFAAEFEQQCEENVPTLFGLVSVGTALPVPDLPQPVPADPATTYVLMHGDPGEFISDGRRMRFSSAEGSVDVVRTYTGLQALVSDASGTLDWYFNLDAPTGRQIGAGLYLGAVRTASEEAPGLEVGGNHSGCNVIEGRFAIHYVEFGPGNAVARLAADLEQHCEGGPKALRAAIRVNSTLPPGFCTGDCNGDRAVTIDEALLGVNALLDRDASLCPALDVDGDGEVSVDAMIRAVVGALEGCVGPATDTP